MVGIISEVAAVLVWNLDLPSFAVLIEQVRQGPEAHGGVEGNAFVTGKPYEPFDMLQQYQTVYTVL